jgi:peptide chain release factor 1
MDLSPILARKVERFRELDSAIADPALFNHPGRARATMREHAQVKDLLEAWQARQRAAEQRASGAEMVRNETDAELAALAGEEVAALDAELLQLDRRIQLALLPPDPNEDRDAIVEIRAGTGGSEAALFAADLHRMYTRYVETIGLKIEPMDSSPSELGGLKEVVFRVSGTSVFRRLRYESGVHRVQRVPATEAQGRIHTSTATVAVEVELELKPEELRIEVCRAGGPGGQGVNTTDSAVQVLHIPTGTIVRCQDGRSQIKNKERALNILRARLLERKQAEEEAAYSAHRKSQIGSGGREEKIRTYNFPQNRVTDHRINLTLYNLDRFIEGDLEEMITALQTQDMEERLTAAGLAG